MIMSLLKFAGVIIVTLALGVLWVVKFVFTLLTDGAVQAKEATPGVTNEVKEHVVTEVSRLPEKFAAIESNVRRFVRIPSRKTTSAPAKEVLQLSA